MSVGIQVHRARIGGFHDRALALGRKLSYLSRKDMTTFFVLYFLPSKHCTVIALLAHIIISNTDPHFSTKYLNQYSSHYKIGKDDSMTSHPKQSPSIKPELLLLLANDVECNPGPNNNTHLCIIHCNVQSLRNKLTLLEAESKAYDIITLSETWLSNSISNDSMCIPNFHPPVRRDRPLNTDGGLAHGGVAIYVRNTLYCKPRPDLQIAELEAVWVEKKNKSKEYFNWFLLPAPKCTGSLLGAH